MQPVHCSPSAFGLLLRRRPASSLLMGFQKRRYAFCTAFKPPPAASNPSQRLWPTPASQACLFSSYGLPKATLRILHRLQTLPRDFKPFPAPLAYSCVAALPASAGSPPAPLAYSCVADLPLLFLWASKSDVRHFAPPSNPPPRLQTLPSAFGLLLHRSLACVRREPGERASGTCSPCTAAPAPLAYSCIAGLPLLFLWASISDVTHFAPPSNPRPRLQTLPSAFGLLLHRRPASSLLMGFQKRRYAFCTAFKPSPATSNPSQRLWPTPASQPCLRQPGAPQRLWPTPASQTCLFSSYGLPKATLGILRRLQTLPRGFKPFPAPLAYSCIAALPAQPPASQPTQSKGVAWEERS